MISYRPVTSASAIYDLTGIEFKDTEFYQNANAGPDCYLPFECSTFRREELQAELDEIPEDERDEDWVQQIRNEMKIIDALVQECQIGDSVLVFVTY